MQFDFGQNWKDFSDNALDNTRVQGAKKDFQNLFKNIDFKEKTFLDIGFGQGLGLLIAKETGAFSVGNDINPKCDEALKISGKYFENIDIASIPVIIGSILEKTTLDQIKRQSDTNTFDIVQSWGVLHHTGNMQLAIDNACSLVSSGGYFIIAIYNKHWTSPLWKAIKWTYCKSPSLIKKIMIGIFLPIKWMGAYITTGKNPAKKERGMNFYHDIVDWIGGYPYEYATVEEIEKIFTKKGFDIIKSIPTNGYTGCNQFVFKKK